MVEVKTNLVLRRRNMQLKYVASIIYTQSDVVSKALSNQGTVLQSQSYLRFFRAEIPSGTNSWCHVRLEPIKNACRLGYQKPRIQCAP